MQCRNSKFLFVLPKKNTLKSRILLQNCRNCFIWYRPSPNVSTTPITAMGCWQCLPLSVVQLKGKHCRKRQCWNVVVDTFGPDDTIWPKTKKVQYWFSIFIVLGIYYFVFHWDCCVIHSNFMWNIATNFPFAYNIKS